MNEIFAFIGNDRRRVTVGYKLDDKVVRVHRKIDGHDRPAIEDAIGSIKAMGIEEILIEVYRPNGTAEKLVKTFVLPADKINIPAKPMALGNPTLFQDAPPVIHPTRPSPRLQQTTQRPNTISMDWKDYALNTEKEKVSKLEAEVKRLSIKSETLDKQVRDFEKEMIKKDHELEKLQGQLENKSGLGGFVEKAAENPAMMNVLAGIANRILGMPEQQPTALNAPADPNANPSTEQYIANIRAWLSRQPLELQEQFYQLVFEITNAKDVSAHIIQLTNLVKNGTVLKRTA